MNIPATPSAEVQRLLGLIRNAMRVSTDPVTAVGAESVAALGIESPAQAIHLARCVAAFTTDDALAGELTELVDESPAFLVSKVLAVNFPPEACTGANAELETRIWRALYAGRRERKRVRDTLLRRGVL